jgi:hypothetical protein
VDARNTDLVAFSQKMCVATTKKHGPQVHSLFVTTKLGADIKSEIEYDGEKLPPLYYAATRGD